MQRGLRVPWDEILKPSENKLASPHDVKGDGEESCSPEDPTLEDLAVVYRPIVLEEWIPVFAEADQIPELYRRGEEDPEFMQSVREGECGCARCRARTKRTYKAALPSGAGEGQAQETEEDR